MGTTNEASVAESLQNRKNWSYKERIASIDAELDILNSRLSDDGTDDGTPDTATDAAVVAAKVQTAIISGRIDALFPVVKGDGVDLPTIISATVEDATPTKIDLVYNGDVSLTDATGFSVSGSTLATSISSAVVETNKTLVTLTANDAVANAEDVLLSYNGATGNVISDVDADAAVTQADIAVVNNVAA